MPVFDPAIFDVEIFDAGEDIDEVAAAAYAGMLIDLLPRGRLLSLIETLLREVIEASAIELARVHTRVIDLLRESVPSTADELIPEYEEEHELESTGTEDERRARIVAHTVADQGVRPIDFATTLAPLLGQDPGDVVVLERTAAFAASLGDPREIFRFFVYRDPNEPGDYYVTSAQVLLDRIVQSHTAGYVIESIDFLADDPFSLTDRDLLGA